MPNIAEAISHLTQFSEEDGIQNVIASMRILETVEAEASDEIRKHAKERDDIAEIIKNLRIQLRALSSTLKNMVINKGNLSLADVLYQALLAIAAFKPINAEDFITQDEILAEDRVVASSGYQYDLNSLMRWHNTREYRGTGSDSNETPDSKWLLNPATDAPFDPKDTAHIEAVCVARELEMIGLRSSEYFYQTGKKQVEQEDRRSPDRYPNSFAAGEDLLQKAVRAGHPEAAFLLAQIYSCDFDHPHTLRKQPVPKWWGAKQDYALGADYLRIAVNTGHELALIIYFVCLYLGKEELGIVANREQSFKILEGKNPQVILENLEALSEEGSRDATEVLRNLYREGDAFFGIQLTPERETRYRLRLDNSPRQILSLDFLRQISEASRETLATTLYEAALLHFNSRGHVCFALRSIAYFAEMSVIPNIRKGMEYLQLSLDEENDQAALELAGVYSGRETCSLVDNYGIDTSGLNSMFFNLYMMSMQNGCHFDVSGMRDLQNPGMAVQVLKRGCDLGGPLKNACALMLARLHREYQIEGYSTEARRDEVLRCYHIAVELDTREARAELGSLYLVGSTELSLEANLANAMQAFGPVNSAYQAHTNANAIGAIAGRNPAYISHYLFWLLQSVRLDCEDTIKMHLHHVLNVLTNRTVTYPALREFLESPANLDLTNLIRRWEVFSAHWANRSLTSPDYYDGDDEGFNRRFTHSNEYQELARDTCHYFGVPLPAYNPNPRGFWRSISSTLASLALAARAPREDGGGRCTIS